MEEFLLFYICILLQWKSPSLGKDQTFIHFHHPFFVLIKFSFCLFVLVFERAKGEFLKKKDQKFGANCTKLLIRKNIIIWWNFWG
jgi:hypothetical protein